MAGERDIEIEVLLDGLSAQGVELWEEGGALGYRVPRGWLTPDRRGELARRKPELLALLRQRGAREAAERASRRGRPQGGSSPGAPRVEPDAARRHDPFPLTDLQGAYLIGRSGAFELGNTACHVYFELDGPGLDLRRFEEVWRRLVARHDMLRSVILPGGLQRILPEVPPYEIACVDCTAWRPADRDRHLAAVRSEMSHQVLAVERWPLFDVRATRLGPGLTRLHLGFDLLIADSWSLQVLAREIGDLYHGPARTLPPLDLSFRDYVLAEQALQGTAQGRRALEYWRPRLATLPPAPELPLARDPASLTRPRFERRAHRVAPGPWARFKALCARHGLTPSGGLCAAFASTLATWSKSAHFTLNLTAFNRTPVHPQVADVLGDFSSTVLLEVRPGTGSFAEYARGVQQQLWRDLEHGSVSGVRVLRELARARGERRKALMPVVFTSNLLHGAAGSGPHPLASIGTVTYAISQTPQVWLDHQVYEFAGALELNWDTVDELFPAGLLDEAFGAYCGLLDRLAADEAAWETHPEPLVPPAQRARHAGINATAAAVPRKHLQTLFAEQLPLAAKRPAVITPHRTLTYEELACRASQVGRIVRAAGARPGELVAVAMEKGWEQVVGVLGVLQAGAAYLPLDPHLPRERLWALLEDARAAVVLTQARFPASGWPAGARVVAVDELTPAAEDAAATWDPVQRVDDLAYVIYTSGSTGKPKGVMIEHQGAVNTILDVNQRFGVGPTDRALALSALSFDLSVYDIFGMLAAGGALVIPDGERMRDPAHWLDLADRERVTIWNSVPAFAGLAAERAAAARGRLPRSLRLVMCSGDWIPVDLPDRLRALGDGLEVVSLGGATEASIWSILHRIGEVDPTWSSIPYGKPMLNQRFHVLDEHLEERPDWTPGELYIGGAGLARGYWGDEARTARSFVTHPRTGERLYRTGDLGRHLPGGEIEFLGREDFQVKVAGFRIECGEIEVALKQHPAVREAVVAAVGSRTGADRRLVAWVVPGAGAGEEAAGAEALRAFLAAKLPAHMIPAAFVPLAALPLTANGKVDRRALPDPTPAARPAGVHVAPTNEVERRLAEILKQGLGLSALPGIHDNFFELGATSLLLVQLQARMREALGVELSPLVLFERTTIAALAEHIATGGRSEETTDEGRARAETRRAAGGRRAARRAARDAPGAAGVPEHGGEGERDEP